jgi:hypothetical protein
MDTIFEQLQSERTAVYASSADFPWTREAAKSRLRTIEDVNPKASLAKVNGRHLDYSWLRGASETYRISPNIQDYLISEVPIVTVDIPNRNLHCFPYNEVTYFDPRFGRFIYQTFVGKPTFVDHNNRDFTQARGVHFDATMRKVPGWNLWKIYVLLGYDRTKDAALVKRIERGERRGYSMGAWVGFFINSITGQIANGTQALKYPVGTVVNDILSFLLCNQVEYFETSSVAGPADVSAESNQLWYF